MLKTDLPDHFRFNWFKSLLSHAGQLSCCDVTDVTCPKTGFSAADDADARSVVFVFIQINTFTYLRKIQTIKHVYVYVRARALGDEVMLNVLRCQLTY